MSAYSEASKAVFERVRGHRRRWSRASRSTRRSSTSAACGGSRARRWRSPAKLRSEVRERVGLPITVGVARDEVPREGRERAWRSRTGCSSCPPERELEFLHPLPVERLWGVGPVTRGEAPRARASRPSARWPGSTRARARRAARPGGGAAPARAGAQPRPAARCGSGGAAARSASQRALGRAADAVGRGRRGARRARRPRHAAHAHGRADRPHRHPPAAVRRLLPRDAVAHAAATRPPRHGDDPRDGAGAARGGGARDRAARPHARRRRRRQPRRRRARCSSPCRSSGTTAARSTRPWTRCGERFGPAAVTRAVLLGRDAGSTCRCSPTEGVSPARIAASFALSMLPPETTQTILPPPGLARSAPRRPPPRPRPRRPRGSARPAAGPRRGDLRVEPDTIEPATSCRASGEHLREHGRRADPVHEART